MRSAADNFGAPRQKKVMWHQTGDEQEWEWPSAQGSVMELGDKGSGSNSNMTPLGVHRGRYPAKHLTGSWAVPAPPPPPRHRPATEPPASGADCGTSSLRAGWRLACGRYVSTGQGRRPRGNTAPPEAASPDHGDSCSHSGSRCVCRRSGTNGSFMSTRQWWQSETVNCCLSVPRVVKLVSPDTEKLCLHR